MLEDLRASEYPFRLFVEGRSSFVVTLAADKEDLISSSRASRGRESSSLPPDRSNDNFVAFEYKFVDFESNLGRQSKEWRYGEMSVRGRHGEREASDGECQLDEICTKV